MSADITSPFPWFGGKRRVAGLVWERLGNVPNYVEPFFGSGAVLLARPSDPGNEIVNDKDRFVANAWRAISSSPDEVFKFAGCMTNETDIRARHRYMHSNKEFADKMDNDPHFYDAKLAGWWIWGVSCTIAQCFSRPEPNNSIPLLTTKGVQTGKFTRKLFEHISNRMRLVKVCCGDWERVVSKCATFGQGLTGVFLDPPYETDDSNNELYSNTEAGLSKKVRDWAVSSGGNPLLRIALCGYEGEHEMPKDWECVSWKAANGYGSHREDNENGSKERIWFSPHCLNGKQPDLFGSEVVNNKLKSILK